jgi:outer membrane protein assembly factor BamB
MQAARVGVLTRRQTDVNGATTRRSVVRMIKTAIAVVLFLAFSAGASGSAYAGLADSAWPMFQGGVAHAGRSAYTGPRGSPVLKWSFTVQGMPGSPALAPDGTIYLPTGMLNEDSRGYLYAVRPDGTQKWRYDFAGLPSSTAPAVAADGTVYVHVNGNEGNIVAVEKLYALNPDGSLRWVFKPNGDLGSFTSYVQSSPAISADGTVYVGSMNTTLCAVSPGGTLKWAVSPSESSISSSPALGPDGTVYFLDSGFELWAYGADGKKKWSAHLSDASGGEGSPTVAPDGTVYVATSGNAEVHAVDWSGSLKWSEELGFSPVATPALAPDGTIYVNDDRLYALRPDGTLRWQSDEDVGFSTGSPVVGADGTVYWRDSWRFRAVAPDGRARWSLSVPSTSPTGLNPQPAIGPNGTLYLPLPDVFDDSNQRLNAYTTAPVPRIASIRPSAGRRGALVTIDGAGFGAKRGAGSVRFGAATCTRYILWSEAQIKCRVPSRARYGVVAVTVKTATDVSVAVRFKVKR